MGLPNLHPRRIAQRTKAGCQEGWLESKQAFLEIWHFARHNDWRKTVRVMLRRKYWGWWILLAVIIALSVALSSYHNQIVEAMKPYQDNIAGSKWAWLVPVILLIIVSFPPLIGHEIIILLVGMIWNLGIGMAIACAGTFAGELATYVAFKYLFRAKARKLEEKHVLYACLARMMREGGLGILVLVRFSALPGHVVTAIQSTIGVGLWKYGVACFLTLPKQFAIVYLGYIYGQTAEKVDHNKPANQQTGEPLNKYYEGQHSRVSLIVFAVTTLATIVAAYIVWIRARRIRPSVLAEMAERRKADLQEMGEVSHSRASVLGRRLSDTPQMPLQRFSIDTMPFRPALVTPYLPGPSSASVSSLLGSEYTINDSHGGRSRSSTINTRSRSGTVNTLYSLSRTPSMPDMHVMEQLKDLQNEEKDEALQMNPKRSTMLL